MKLPKDLRVTAEQSGDQEAQQRDGRGLERDKGEHWGDATVAEVAGNLRRWWFLLVAITGASLIAGTIVLLTSHGRSPGTAAPPTTTKPAKTTPASTTSTTSTSTTVPPPPPLTWTACDGGRQCATLNVPLDYSSPAGPHNGIALERHVATDPSARIGSLVINPGGPGESGILNFSKDLPLLPATVLARFDVIAFDPRGIGKSSPLHCDGDTFSGTVDPVPQTAATRSTLAEADAAYAQACLHTAGAPLLEHVGSVDVARDLESLRQAVGDRGLSYLGISYGTLLGATYAAMFPTHVRAMVLDGALDPAMTTDQLSANQAAGFERALNSFFAWCAANACAWRPKGDYSAAYRALANSVRAHPLVVSPTETVGPEEFYTGTFSTLYAQSFWPSLGRALQAIANGQGGPMLGLYNGYNHVGDPSFNGDANNAITCLDHPVTRDLSVYPSLAASAAVDAPDFGPLFAWGSVTCAVWPVPSTRPVGPTRAAGSPPILVVGTTQDPATPYAWAQGLASELQHGVLLTRVGQDHVAIFYSSCVRAWDESYLVGLDPPPTGTVCPG
jgi:pimeloyl-ACP methyl ester carboxylesterase